MPWRCSIDGQCQDQCSTVDDTYLLRLGILLRLPLVHLLLELLDGGGDIGLAGGGVHVDLGKLVKHTEAQAELGLSRSSRSLAALLVLLATSANEVVLLIVSLFGQTRALEAGVIDSALSGCGESAGGGGLLGRQSGGVKVTDQTLSGEDLILESGSAGLLETLRSSLLALGRLPLQLLLALALLTSLASLVVVVCECAACLEVGVLVVLDGLELGLLVVASAIAGLDQGLHVLEGTVLLSLQSVELLLQLGVALAESLLLGVVQKLLLLRDLGLDVVNRLLLSIETGEVLAGLVERGDLGERLLLVDELHAAGVNLLLQALNLAIDVLNSPKVDLSLRSLQLGDAALELLVQALDLIHDGSAARLLTLLGLADRVELRLELLLAEGIRRVLVVGAGGVELGFGGILHSIVRTSTD